MLESLRQDVWHSLRSIVKAPAVPLIVIAVLALGIGANTALFSILDRVLLHPFPFRDPDRLVQLRGLTDKGADDRIAPAEFEYLQPRVSSFELMAMWRWTSPLLTAVPDPENVFGHEVSSALFKTLGVAPSLGRTLQADDYRSSAPRVAVIGDRLWRRQFHADPSIVGRQIILDRTGHTVVGVMGPDFVFVQPVAQMWVPLLGTAEQAGELQHSFNAMARIKAGVPVEEARQELERVSRLIPVRPGIPLGWHAGLRGFAESYSGQYRRALMVLWGAVGIVLLIACANAANLMLARASHRRREFALRASLGANRIRLAQQLIAESLLLGLAAGVLGVALATASLRAIATAFPAALPRLEQISVNATALWMTIGLVMLTTLLCAVPPCLELLRANLAGGLTDVSRSASASRGSNRVRSALIAFEVALSMVLLVGAGLMLRSLSHLFDVHLGFEPQHVLTAQVAAPPQLKEKSAQAAYYSRMLGEIGALPGARSVAINTILPFGHLAATTSFIAEGSQVSVELRRSQGFAIHLRSISPAYFSTMGIRLLQGRPFLATDSAGGARVAIVNDTLARRYWPGESPIGKRVSRNETPKPNDWSTVVGVVESTQRQDLASKPEAEIYSLYTQDLTGSHYTTLLVRTDGEPLWLAQSLRSRVRELNPQQPVAEVKTMQAWVRESTAAPRLHTLLFEIFAGLALTLAASGVLAVVSYAVTQRTREIGIRSALGATPPDIVRFVLLLGLRPVLIGACAGIAGALAATPVLKSQLFETGPADPMVFASVLAILIGTAVCAAAFPAWRATRVDPVTTLRAE